MKRKSPKEQSNETKAEPSQAAAGGEGEASQEEFLPGPRVTIDPLEVMLAAGPAIEAERAKTAADAKAKFDAIRFAGFPTAAAAAASAPAPGDPIEDPIRSSFSLDRASREAIREAADAYGTTQGAVVGLAPTLYRIAAERSLKKRRDALPSIQKLADGVRSSLEAIRGVAPHLGLGVTSLLNDLDEVIEMERRAIDNREVAGVWESSSHTYVGRNFAEFLDEGDKDALAIPNPFIETLQEMLAEIGMLEEEAT